MEVAQRLGVAREVVGEGLRIQAQKELGRLSMPDTVASWHRKDFWTKVPSQP